MDSISIVFGLDRPELLHEETLVDMFRMSAKQYGSKTALIFQQTSLSYAQLDRWTDAVAAFLFQKGIRRGDKVGLWWPRSVELHVAVLGIAKAGASYVPLDREMPAERVVTVLTEVGASACFTDGKLDMDLLVFVVPPIPSVHTEIEIPEGPLPDNWAYVLYTSGSTGKPKGIPISHRQICHLVRSEQYIFNISADDKVYQGFSVSFDMWCEETWISFFVGATILVADAIAAKSIDELSDVLRNNNITILHAVPSLLAVMDENVPSVRLVNAGGEACTPQVLERWSKPPRLFFNSYGPTETTVTATIAALNPGDKITIGQPLPNYDLAVVDEQLNPLPRGQRGELIITGPGVSEGYVNRPDLTIEKFVTKPASLAAMHGDRVYHTGDAAIINPDGSIDFQGRIDDQIKLRGYRIELGEIESQLNLINGISAAAVAVRKDNNDQDRLVGYIVLNSNIPFDEVHIRAELGKLLPVYMVPGVIMPMPELPRLPSGKIDRKSLPTPTVLLEEDIISQDEPIDINAPLAERVLAMLHKVFPHREIDLSKDFFTDLGGHSLVAASFVSRLRSEAGVPNASLKDIYTNRPLQALVNEWDKRPKAEAKKKRIYNQAPWWRHTTCWIAQTFVILMVYGLFAMQIFMPYMGYYYVQQETGNHGYAILASLCLFCFIPPVFSGITIITKWLVIGKMKEGDYPLWGTYYFRWWLVNVMQRLVPSQFLNGTPLYPVYLRLMGVKIAADAQLGAISIGAEDLVTIGNDVSISSQAILNNAVVEDGWLKLRHIHLGDHAYIGSSAVIAGGTTVEAWGELQDLSFLPTGKTIRTGEVWQGSPAQCIATRTLEELPQPLEVTPARQRKYSMIFLLSLLVFPFAVLLPLFPILVIINELDNAYPDYDFGYLKYMPILAFIYIILFSLVTIGLTRLLQRGIKPGTYPIHSKFYVRKWFADQLMSLSLIVLHPIYATVYISRFFRALGAKVGPNTEISTASSVTHPLLEIGSGAFVADAVTLGESDVRAQQLILNTTTIGDNSFVGNSALIPQGYHLPGNMLIGVLSTPPSSEQLAANTTAKDWFGSPAIALPRRQESNPFPAGLTTTPSPTRKLARSLVELLRIILPETAVLCFSILFIAYGHDLLVGKNILRMFTLFPFYYLGFIGLPAFLLTVLLKWILVGKYKAEQKPMWTWKVWRSEAITTTYEALSVPFLLEYLKGTPWLPIAMRLFGVKIGRRVWMNTTDITEFDMVSIGNDVAMNDDCGPQTHLFEDRVMKIGAIRFGNRCTVGARSIILYDSEIGDDVKLDALSLVMKGEQLQSGTDWVGSPVKPA
ncbi:MAG: Pls/PosA family non-ribosomal peptide synthetase [Bacteroidota bacterium]